jgi:hypothetical protein
VSIDNKNHSRESAFRIRQQNVNRPLILPATSFNHRIRAIGQLQKVTERESRKENPLE